MNFQFYGYTCHVINFIKHNKFVFDDFTSILECIGYSSLLHHFYNRHLYSLQVYSHTLSARERKKFEGTWRQVKIEGSKEKFLSRIFRMYNLGNEKKGQY